MDKFKIQINLNTMGVKITYDNTVSFLATIIMKHNRYDVIWHSTVYIEPKSGLFIPLKNKIIDTYTDYLMDLSIEE